MGRSNLIFLLGCFCVGQLNGESVNLFAWCGNGKSHYYPVRENQNYEVVIDGKDWPSGKTSCEVVFGRTDSKYRSIYYKFSKFQMKDYGTDIKVYSRSSYFLSFTFNKFMPPGREVRKSAGSMLKITVTRRNVGQTGLLATIDLRTKGDKSIIVSAKSFGLTVAGIVGIVAGIIVLVIIIIIVCVCCCIWKSTKRRSNPVVVYGNQAIPQSQPYPTGVPAGQYPMYPPAHSGQPPQTIYPYGQGQAGDIDMTRKGGQVPPY